MSVTKRGLERFLQEQITIQENQLGLALPASKKRQQFSQQNILCGTALLRNSSVLCRTLTFEATGEKRQNQRHARFTILIPNATESFINWVFLFLMSTVSQVSKQLMLKALNILKKTSDIP